MTKYTVNGKPVTQAKAEELAQIREALLDNRIVEWVFGAWQDDEPSEEASEPSDEPNAAMNPCAGITSAFWHEFDSGSRFSPASIMR